MGADCWQEPPVWFSASNTGAVYLLYGNSSLQGIVSLSQADAKLLGMGSSSSTGSALATADYDGDGFLDIFLGASHQDDNGSQSGAVFVVQGPLYGTQSVSTAYAHFSGISSFQYAGTSVDGGDLDGDGVAELLAGATGALTTDPGQVYLVAGGSTGGSFSAADAILSGENGNDQAGASLCFLGDIN